MTRHPATVLLRDVVDMLGRTVVQVLRAPHGLDVEVSGVTIQDPAEAVTAVEGDILLAVGAVDERQVTALLEAAAHRGVAAVLVKGQVPDRSAALGVAVLGLERSASWTQVMNLTHSFLESRAAGRLLGAPAAEEDLFATADAVAALVGAPVVIEDRAARVLAYSGGQEDTDEVRKATILARRDPVEYVRMHHERKVFEALYAGTEPVVLEAMGQERAPRVAVALRAGDEIVGSMWAVAKRPLSGAQLSAYASAAATVALHVLRSRAVEEASERLRVDLLGQVLAGGSGSREAAGHMGLPRQRYRMVAIGHRDRAVPAEEVDELATTVRLFLSAARGRCVIRRMGEVVYAAVAVSRQARDTDEQGVLLALLKEFTHTRPAARPAVCAAVGRGARSVLELRASREDCDQVLRVLRSGLVEGDVASHDEVQLGSLPLRMSDTLAQGDEQLHGPVERLLAYDRKNGSGLVATLETHFAVLGDVASAAERLQVHPNTFRYRLRRITAVSGLDPFDAEALMAAVLQLRLGQLGAEGAPGPGRGRGAAPREEPGAAGSG